jgi:hypothetical protein
MDIPRGKAERHCCRVEIHCGTHPVETDAPRASGAEYTDARAPPQVGGRAPGISVEEGGASCGREGPRPHDAPVGNEHQILDPMF